MNVWLNIIGKYQQTKQRGPN